MFISFLGGVPLCIPYGLYSGTSLGGTTRGILGGFPGQVLSGQASHVPPMNEPEPTAGGAIDILQQLAQALQRAAQPAAVAPQRSAIERMARYRPINFLGLIKDEPSMADNWLERTE